MLLCQKTQHLGFRSKQGTEIWLCRKCALFLAYSLCWGGGWLTLLFSMNLSLCLLKRLLFYSTKHLFLFIVLFICRFLSHLFPIFKKKNPGFDIMYKPCIYFTNIYCPLFYFLKEEWTWVLMYKAESLNCTKAYFSICWKKACTYYVNLLPVQYVGSI